MKYSNKEKWVRRKNWPSVPSPTWTSHTAAKIWCDKYDSDGRYYFHYTNTRWWFEDEQAAIMFSLTWSGK